MCVCVSKPSALAIRLANANKKNGLALWGWSVMRCGAGRSAEMHATKIAFPSIMRVRCMCVCVGLVYFEHAVSSSFRRGTYKCITNCLRLQNNACVFVCGLICVYGRHDMRPHWRFMFSPQITTHDIFAIVRRVPLP